MTNNKKLLQLSLANWLFLRKPVKICCHYKRSSNVCKGAQISHPLLTGINDQFFVHSALLRWFLNVEQALIVVLLFSFSRMPNTVLKSKRWTPIVGCTPRFTWTPICSENSTLFLASGRLAGDFRRSTMMSTALTPSTISGFHFSSYCRCVAYSLMLN